jgi:hypothetical protein
LKESLIRDSLVWLEPFSTDIALESKLGSEIAKIEGAIGYL